MKILRGQGSVREWGGRDFLAWEPAPGTPALPWQQRQVLGGTFIGSFPCECLRSFKIPAGFSTHPPLLWITAWVLENTPSHPEPWQAQGMREGGRGLGGWNAAFQRFALECQLKSLDGKCDQSVIAQIPFIHLKWDNVKGLLKSSVRCKRIGRLEIPLPTV